MWYMVVVEIPEAMKWVHVQHLHHPTQNWMRPFNLVVLPLIAGLKWHPNSMVESASWTCNPVLWCPNRSTISKSTIIHNRQQRIMKGSFHVKQVVFIVMGSIWWGITPSSLREKFQKWPLSRDASTSSLLGNFMERDNHIGPYPHQHTATMSCMRERAWVCRGWGNFRHYDRCWDSDYSRNSSNEDWVQRLMDHIKLIERHMLDIQVDLIDLTFHQKHHDRQLHLMVDWFLAQ